MGTLISHTIIKGIIRCETALKIGGTKDSFEIGGVDNPVIKDSITGMPYIPGSSLKGKMRSLIELRENKYNKQYGEPYDGKLPNGQEDLDCDFCRIFGPHRNPKHSFGPTRLIVRDAKLTTEWEEIFKARKSEKGDNFLEIKQENTINRNTHATAGAGPRTFERVPAGTEFEFEFVLRNFNWNEKFGNEEIENLKVLSDAMKLLEKDYLGGSGSRGYGKISFHDMSKNGEPFSL